MASVWRQPYDRATNGSSRHGRRQQSATEVATGDDRDTQFVQVVLADTEEVWGQIFNEGGKPIKSLHWYYLMVKLAPLVVARPPQLGLFIVQEIKLFIWILPSSLRCVKI